MAVARAALTDVPPDDDEEEVPELLLLKVVGKMTVSQKLSLLPVSTTRGGITWSRPIIPIRKKAEKVAIRDETFARKMMTYVVFELAALRIHDCMVWRKGAITLLLIFACPIKLQNEEYYEMWYIRSTYLFLLKVRKIAYETNGGFMQQGKLAIWYIRSIFGKKAKRARQNSVTLFCTYLFPNTSFFKYSQ